MLLRSPNVYKFNWTYSGTKTRVCKSCASEFRHLVHIPCLPPPSPLANIVAKKPLWTSELVVPVPLHRSVVYFIFLRHVFRFKSYVLLNPPAYFRVWYVVPVFFCLSSMKPLLSHLIVAWCWVLTSSFTCKPFRLLDCLCYPVVYILSYLATCLVLVQAAIHGPGPHRTPSDADAAMRFFIDSIAVSAILLGVIWCRYHVCSISIPHKLLKFCWCKLTTSVWPQFRWYAH